MNREIVAVGASSGGIRALQILAANLEPNLQAALPIVQHTAPESPGFLPEILRRAGGLPTAYAVDGEPPRLGSIHIAAPDRHMLVDNRGHIRLSRGPRENRSRPAVDPMFRSVALAYGPRAIGVVLSGYLNDGASGLGAIALAGGTCLVEEPRSAVAAGMPLAALRQVGNALRAPVEDLGGLITSLVREPVTVSKAMPHRTTREIEIEAAIAAGDTAALAGTASLGKPSGFTCPECHGALFGFSDAPSLQRYRCHTGHAFTAEALMAGMHEATENALWSAVRALQEEAILMQHMANHAKRRGDTADAQHLADAAARAKSAADMVRSVEQDGSRD